MNTPMVIYYKKRNFNVTSIFNLNIQLKIFSILHVDNKIFQNYL